MGESKWERKENEPTVHNGNFAYDYQHHTINSRSSGCNRIKLKYYDTRIAKLQQRLPDRKKGHHASLRTSQRLRRRVNANARAA